MNEQQIRDTKDNEKGKIREHNETGRKRKGNPVSLYLGEPIEECEELVQHFHQILGAIGRRDGGKANDIRIEYALRGAKKYIIIILLF